MVQAGGFPDIMNGHIAIIKRMASNSTVSLMHVLSGGDMLAGVLQMLPGLVAASSHGSGDSNVP